MNLSSSKENLPSFVQEVEDLSPNGCLLLICGMPFRVHANDQSIYTAIKIASRWQPHEITFGRINFLNHWISINSKFVDFIPVVNILSMADAKVFIDKVIERGYYPNSIQQNKYLAFNADLFSLSFNNYKIGGI